MPKTSQPIQAAKTAALKRSKLNRSGPNTYKVWSIGIALVIGIASVLVMMNPPKTIEETSVHDDGLMYQIKSNEKHWVAQKTPMFEGYSLADAKRLSFGQIGGGNVPQCQVKDDSEVIPEHFDSRERWPHCFNTKVYTGGNCTSSWAIASASAFGNRMCISDPNTYSDLQLSPQQLLSCDKSNQGCAGGNVQAAFEFIMREGLVTEKCFPYTGETTKTDCSDRCTSDKPIRMGSYCAVQEPKAAMREIMANGPLLGVLFMTDDILVYKDGNYKSIPTSRTFLDDNKSRLFTGVTVLGFGSDNGRDYWLVENSWGPEWGVNGVAKVARVEGDGREGGAMWQAWMFAPMPPTEPLESKSEDELDAELDRVLEEDEEDEEKELDEEIDLDDDIVDDEDDV